MIPYVFNDGGRAAAGYKGETGDCGVRAMAIALQLPYQTVYEAANAFGSLERGRKGRGGKVKRSSARTGIFTGTMDRMLAGHGWVWKATMGIGTGCKVHLKADELPMGRLIVRVTNHYAAVIDRVLHDNHDCSREGTRCVYGYWHKPA